MPVIADVGGQPGSIKRAPINPSSPVNAATRYGPTVRRYILAQASNFQCPCLPPNQVNSVLNLRGSTLCELHFTPFLYLLNLKYFQWLYIGCCLAAQRRVNFYETFNHQDIFRANIYRYSVSGSIYIHFQTNDKLSYCFIYN